MKNIFSTLFISFLFVIISSNICAQVTYSGGYFDVRGPLYTRSDQYIVNKANKGWTKWAERDTTSQSQSTLNLSNINKAFFLGSVGICTPPRSEAKLSVSGDIYMNSGSIGNHIYWAGNNNMTMGTLPDDNTHNVFNLKPGGSNTGKLITVFSMWNANNKTTFEERIQLRSEGLSFLNGGNVGIGTKNPDALLTVNGTIHAKEILVNVIGFPDFVFEGNYKLQKLQEVDNYIQLNGHLPNIPSAKDVENKGMNLADMQIKLLQKVEELTLYVINQQKEIDSLKRELQTSK